jgi:hypothetical protein
MVISISYIMSERETEKRNHSIITNGQHNNIFIYSTMLLHRVDNWVICTE